MPPGPAEPQPGSHTPGRHADVSRPREATTDRPPAGTRPAQSRFARAATKMSARRIRNANRASGTLLLAPKVLHFAPKLFVFARHLNTQTQAVPDETRKPNSVDTV